VAAAEATATNGDAGAERCLLPVAGAVLDFPGLFLSCEIGWGQISPGHAGTKLCAATCTFKNLASLHVKRLIHQLNDFIGRQIRA
jgi:hypothetical protein